MTELIEFDELSAKIKVFVQPTLEMRVTSPETCALAIGVAREIKAYEKLIEAKRVELKAPHLERTRAIDAKVKQIVEPLLTSERHLKLQLAEWERRLATEREVERKRLADLKAKAEAEIAANEQAAREAAVLTGGLSPMDDSAAVARAGLERQVLNAEQDISESRVPGSRKTWRFELLTAAAVPREYCEPDPSLIREAIKRGVREIAGVRIYEDVVITLR